MQPFLSTFSSSNVIGGIKAVLFICFFTKRFHTHKKHKNAHKQTKTKKTVLNMLKKHLKGRKSLVCLYEFLRFLCAFYAFLCVKQKDNIFMRMKTSKRKKVACLKFFAFYAFCVCIKRLSESRLFDVLCFLCVWNLFLRKNKTALISSIILLLFHLSISQLDSVM